MSNTQKRDNLLESPNCNTVISPKEYQHLVTVYEAPQFHLLLLKGMYDFLFWQGTLTLLPLRCL